MIHLRSVRLDAAAAGSGYPFDVPAVRELGTVEFEAPVTFLVGENGSGKSTFLEGLASAVEAKAAGRADLARDETLGPADRLGRALRPSWESRTRRGFYLRAEDFFGFALRVEEMKAHLRGELARLEAEYEGRSPLELARVSAPFSRDLADLQKRYGEGLDSGSHGENFLAFFRNRFVPGGLYLLDEPEAPLSPLRQLAFLSMLKGMVEQEAQFVIATHSPILMAFPGAVILGFDSGAPRPVPYDEVEHVGLTRDFLNDPERFLRRL